MIRKVYTDLILRKLREDGASWLFKRARQYMLLQFSERLHRPLCGPALGTLMVTYRCNFHCGMCDMPRKALTHHQQGEQEFSTERFMGIIKDFAQLGIPGIGFTGGEPLLREDIFELMAETRRLGMIAHLNTNGWLLGDVQAQKVIDSGVDSVNISLDGATAGTHDSIRNQEGSFDRAIHAVKRLVFLKKKHNSHVRIKTVAVINEANIDEVPLMLELGKSMGIDCIELIPRQPFVTGEGETLATDNQDLLAKVDNMIQNVLVNRQSGIPIENSPRHLKLFHRSFAGHPSPLRCSAGYNSLAVDCYGNIFPCVPWINWGKPTGNISAGNLSDIWYSKAYQQQREKTGQCHDCYLNCQTEMNLLFHLKNII